MTKRLVLDNWENACKITVDLGKDGACLFETEFESIYMNPVEVKSLLTFLKQNLEIKLENV